MSRTTHQLLGFAPPVVKNGEVVTPCRIGDEVVNIAGTPEMWQQLANAAAQARPRSPGRPRKSDASKAAEGQPLTKPGGGL